jgi:hypothetical protein
MAVRVERFRGRLPLLALHLQGFFFKIKSGDTLAFSSVTLRCAFCDPFSLWGTMQNIHRAVELKKKTIGDFFCYDHVSVMGCWKSRVALSRFFCWASAFIKLQRTFFLFLLLFTLVFPRWFENSIEKEY